MKTFFIFLISIFIGNGCIAQQRLLLDSSNVVERSFNPDALQDFKKDKDFQYDRFREPPKSLWDRFWAWVWSRIREILSTKSGRTTIWSILLIAGIAAIIFFVVKVMGMRDGGLFGRTTGNDFPYTTSADDINHIHFEDAITNAIETRNYRLAIRLLYLQSLKNLSDKGYIQWQINKTNSDYITEVSANSWLSLFKKLTYNFEYIWYGEMNVGHEDFQNLQVQFHQFNNQL